VRHLNGCRTDNRIDNLDWGTAKDNWSDRKAIGNGVHENHHAARLTMADADEIRASALSQRRLAKRYGVSQSLIWDIKHRRVWVPAPPAAGRNIALPEPTNLWVRERCLTIAGGTYRGVRYIADGADTGDWNRASDGGRWDVKSRPSIHMPRWASRLTLAVTDVRVQRLKDISEEDAMAEGLVAVTAPNGHVTYQIPGLLGGQTPRRAYALLWDLINAKRGYGWDANPWVVALTFTTERRNIDQKESEDDDPDGVREAARSWEAAELRAQAASIKRSMGR
jgi:hypothetical protein